MGLRNAGIVSDVSAVAATAFNRVQLDPAANRAIEVTEWQVAHDGPANSTDVPVLYQLRRYSTVGVGTASAPVKVHDTIADTLLTAGQVENTADGTLVETLDSIFVPIVSGYIWVGAPGRERGCIPANFIGLRNNTTLPAGRSAAVTMVFDE